MNGTAVHALRRSVFVVEMSNATLSSLAGFQAANPDLTITIDRVDLEPVIMRKATFASQAMAGRARLAGNPQVLEQLAGCLVHFDPYFEILPGTKVAPAARQR